MLSLGRIEFLWPYAFCNKLDEIDFFQRTRNRQMDLSLFVYQHSGVNHFYSTHEQNEKWFKSRHSCVTLELEWQLKKWPPGEGRRPIVSRPPRRQGTPPRVLMTHLILIWRWLHQWTDVSYSNVCRSIVWAEPVRQTHVSVCCVNEWKSLFQKTRSAPVF